MERQRPRPPEKAIRANNTNKSRMEHDHEHKQPVFGEAIQAAMNARGANLTLDEARGFFLKMLRLYELGALRFYDVEGNEVTLSDTE